MGAIGPGQLGALYSACSGAMVLYARQWLEDDLARDAVQEVFLALMRQEQPPRNVKAWLFRSLRNASLNLLRSQERSRRHQQARAATNHEWFQPRAEDLIDARTAQEALGSLPQEQREIVVLRLWAGLTLEEISQTLDLPVSTIFGKYRQAIEAIRKELKVPCNHKNL